MTSRALLRRATASVVALCILISGTSRASADELGDIYIPWTSLLPGWSDQYIPSSENECTSGRDSCLKATLKEMARILDEQGKSCSHHASFSMAYLRMTQTYQATREIDGYYDDVPYMNHMDAVFAKYYTDAYYGWKSGDKTKVPQAWQIAFDASKNKKVTGAGDLFLGINAHVNRDLPFVLAGSGLVTPAGVSGKLDFDKVEDWLYLDTAPMLAEAAKRFDPSIGSSNVALVNSLTFQAMTMWRENAWRNAELLVNAPTPAARALVAATIENEAVTLANTFLLTFANVPLLNSNATRDAYCAAHNGDSSTTPYPYMTVTPYGSGA